MTATKKENVYGESRMADANQIDHPGMAAGGAGAGAVAGATIGTLGGPFGAVLGAAVGGIAGALLGEGLGDQFDPVAEDRFWRGEHRNRSYAKGDDYDRYQSAYMYGSEGFDRFERRSYDEAEPQLRNRWNERRTDEDLSWDEASPAVRSSYDRRYSSRDSSDL